MNLRLFHLWEKISNLPVLNYGEKELAEGKLNIRLKEIEIVEKATEFENRKHVYKSTNEKIVASREVKSLILNLNEVYKETKDPEIMEMMKRLTLIKRKVEKRLKGRPDA